MTCVAARLLTLDLDRDLNIHWGIGAKTVCNPGYIFMKSQDYGSSSRSSSLKR